MEDERIKDLEARLAEAERARDEAAADTARLDFLDKLNAGLNARYGTTYRWKLIVNHNVNRLILGHGSVDLHDSEPPSTGLPSCRKAIDDVLYRARTAAPASADEPTP